MSTFDTSELLATGGAFVTTLEDIKKLTASRDARIAALEAEIETWREGQKTVVAELTEWAERAEANCKRLEAEKVDIENQLAAANQEIDRFVSECGRCGCTGQKAEHTVYCPECLAWYREEWGQHSPCANEAVLQDELDAARREIALLTDKLIAASNAKADAKEKLAEISGIDSGSVEAEARDKIQQIGYAETLRRVGDCGKWSLTWESVSNVLELLQEGIISRRKCHETLNSILHGESTNLPELENTAFDDVELPGETVRELRRSTFELSNDLDMAQGKLDQALAELDRERKNGLAMAGIILSGSIDRTAKEAERLLSDQRKAGALWAVDKVLSRFCTDNDRPWFEKMRSAIESGEVEAK